MKQGMVYWILAITGVFVLLFAFASFGQGMGRGGYGMMGDKGYANTPGPYQGAYDEIPKAKQEVLNRILTRHKDRQWKLKRHLLSKTSELNALLYADKIDENRVKALVKDINGIRSKLFEEQVKLKLQLSKKGLLRYIPYMMDRGMRGHGVMMGPGMMMRGYEDGEYEY